MGLMSIQKRPQRASLSLLPQEHTVTWGLWDIKEVDPYWTLDLPGP